MQIKQLQSLIGTIPVDGFWGEKSMEAVKAFQKKAGLTVDGSPGPKTLAKLTKRIDDIGAKRDYLLSKGQFMEEYTQKKGVSLHHTVSSGNIANVVASWDKDSRRVGTPFIIGHKGELTECFPYWYWAHHLGLEHANNVQLNKDLIGIEICSYGSLDYVNGQFFNTYGKIMNEKEVIELANHFKGYKFFHAYKKESIDRLGELLLSLKNIHEWAKYDTIIDSDWFHFDPAKKTTKNLPWLTSHGQFRLDKNDCYPDPYLIQVLNQVL